MAATLIADGDDAITSVDTTMDMMANTLATGDLAQIDVGSIRGDLIDSIRKLQSKATIMDDFINNVTTNKKIQELVISQSQKQEEAMTKLTQLVEKQAENTDKVLAALEASTKADPPPQSTVDLSSVTTSLEEIKKTLLEWKDGDKERKSELTTIKSTIDNIKNVVDDVKKEETAVKSGIKNALVAIKKQDKALKSQQQATKSRFTALGQTVKTAIEEAKSTNTQQQNVIDNINTVLQNISLPALVAGVASTLQTAINSGFTTLLSNILSTNQITPNAIADALSRARNAAGEELPIVIARVMFNSQFSTRAGPLAPLITRSFPIFLSVMLNDELRQLLRPSEPLFIAFRDMVRTEARAMVPELVIPLLTTQYALNTPTGTQTSTIAQQMVTLLGPIMRNDVATIGDNAATSIATYIRDEITSDRLAAAITRVVLAGAAQPTTTPPSSYTLASTLLRDVLQGLAQDQAFLTTLLATDAAGSSPLLTFFAALVRSPQFTEALIAALDEVQRRRRQAQGGGAVQPGGGNGNSDDGGNGGGDQGLITTLSQGLKRITRSSGKQPADASTAKSGSKGGAQSQDADTGGSPSLGAKLKTALGRDASTGLKHVLRGDQILHPSTVVIPVGVVVADYNAINQALLSSTSRKAIYKLSITQRTTMIKRDVGERCVMSAVANSRKGQWNADDVRGDTNLPCKYCRTKQKQCFSFVSESTVLLRYSHTASADNDFDESIRIYGGPANPTDPTGTRQSANTETGGIAASSSAVQAGPPSSSSTANLLVASTSQTFTNDTQDDEMVDINYPQVSPFAIG